MERMAGLRGGSHNQRRFPVNCIALVRQSIIHCVVHLSGRASVQIRR